MAKKYKKSSPQTEADRRLLKFDTYHEYLESLITDADFCYLQGNDCALALAELGYRCSGETLSREIFYKKKASVHLYLFPTYKPYESSSEGLKMGDELMTCLATRERVNRVGILSTIIFVKYQSKSGHEISGYMDYGEKLTSEDWKPFFRDQKRILPKRTDLGYYNWKKDQVVSNDSLNYKVMQSPGSGLLFRNRFDRMIINPAPNAKTGQNTRRKRVSSNMYDIAILFDHLVRQRI